MVPSLLNVRITIQKSTIVSDAIGNHTPEWKAYYGCAATVGGESGSETEKAGTTVETGTLSFTIRYCTAVRDLDTTHYRVAFDGELFNILSIDHKNYKRKAVKLLCQRARR